jgi:outer membrane biosynthesis protein TonB
MLVFRCVFFVARMAVLHVLPAGGKESAGKSAGANPQSPPSLLLALSLAILIHALLLWALTVPSDAKRGAQAASFPVQLRPALQAKLTSELTPALPERVSTAPLTAEASNANVAIQQKAAPQEKRAEPEKQVLEQPRPDVQEQQQREQKQGCLGTEELARLEQARSSNTDPQAAGRAVEVGVACVEG